MLGLLRRSGHHSSTEAAVPSAAPAAEAMAPTACALSASGLSQKLPRVTERSRCASDASAAESVGSSHPSAPSRGGSSKDLTPTQKWQLGARLALGRTEAPRADSGGLPKVPTPLTPLKELEVEVPAAPAAAPPGAFLNSASCEELLSDVAAAALEESTSEGSAYRRTSLGKGMRTSKAL